MKTLYPNYENVISIFENVTSELWKRYIQLWNVLSELKSGFTSRVKFEQMNQKKWTIQSEKNFRVKKNSLKKTTHCNSGAFFLKGKGAD